MGACAFAQALERHFRSIRKTAPAAKPAPLPEPEPEPAPVLEPRTVLQPATVAQAHDSSALPTPVDPPAAALLDAAPRHLAYAIEEID